MEEYHKDLLVLVLVGLLAIEIGGLLLGLLAALMSAGGIGYLAKRGAVLEAIGQFFTENPRALGLSTLVAHAFIVPTRSYVVVRCSRRHGLSWREQLAGLRQLDRERLLKLLPVLALALAMELVPTLLLGETPQAYEEYRFYVQVGTGALGYALALAYYLAEGLWLATVLELGSLRARWGGLAILLAIWAPPHLLRPHGIDVVNLLWALATAVILELSRRVSRNTAVVLALWMTIVLV